ncbi:transposase [Plantactinospora veratri]
MVESLNSRFWQATRRRGHFPIEQAAMKVLYLVVTETDEPARTSPAESPPGDKSSTPSPSRTATGSATLNTSITSKIHPQNSDSAFRTVPTVPFVDEGRDVLSECFAIGAGLDRG